MIISRYPGPARANGGSGPAEQAVERAADLVGQGRVGGTGQAAPGGRPDRDVGAAGSTGRNQRDGLRLPHQPAVQALDLAQPPDQVSAAALGAALEFGGPVGRFLAGRADEH